MQTALGSLRGWLRRCPAIGDRRPFGADYLSDAPGSCALFGLPFAPRRGENIRGERRLSADQAREFLFAVRADYGADGRGNLENLAFMRGVADWVIERAAAGDFPDWPDGTVTDVAPVAAAVPGDFGAGSARYQMKLRVSYRPAGR